MKEKSGSKLVYLWALTPLASAGLYFVTMAIDPGLGAFWRTITQISVMGVILCLAAIFLTGFAGSRLAKAGKGFLRSALIFCAVPIVCAVVFTVLLIIGREESNVALIFLFAGNGMSLAATDYVMALIGKTSTAIEAYASFLLTVLSFTVGYAFGVSRPKKKK